MATGGQTPIATKDPDTSLTDCPLCKHLCLGPCILPCGHVTCRHCVRMMIQPLNFREACQQCGQTLDLSRYRGLSVSQFIGQMGTDPIKELLVQAVLQKETDVQCKNCLNVKAVNVCQDCRDCFCGSCSKNHRSSVAGEGHVLQQLHHALRNAPSTARDQSRPDLTLVRASTSLNNDVPSVYVDLWADWAGKEEAELRKAYRKQTEVAGKLKEILSQGEELLKKVEIQREFLEAYHERLPQLDVIECTDPSTIIVGASYYSDARMKVKTESLKRRLCYIRQRRQCPDLNAVQRISTQLTQLLVEERPDHQRTPVTNRATQGRSAVHVPSSAALPTPPDPVPHSIDVMVVRPRAVYTVSPATADCRQTPYITSLVCLPDGRIAMTDYRNRKVMVMNTSSPPAVSASVDISASPRRLALLDDRKLALTTDQLYIFLLTVGNDCVSITSRIPTQRRYTSVAGLGAERLIAGCETSLADPAALHMLTTQGELVCTVTDSFREPMIGSPVYMCNRGDNHVLVSDWRTHSLLEIDLTSGLITQTLQHTDLERPCQVCEDSMGGVFVASDGGECVLGKASGDGPWRKLITPSEHRNLKSFSPLGLCLTRRGRLAVAWNELLGDSFIIVYDLC